MARFDSIIRNLFEHYRVQFQKGEADFDEVMMVGEELRPKFTKVLLVVGENPRSFVAIAVGIHLASALGCAVSVLHEGKYQNFTRKLLKKENLAIGDFTECSRIHVGDILDRVREEEISLVVIRASSESVSELISSCPCPVVVARLTSERMQPHAPMRD